MRAVLDAEPRATVDYAEVVDAETLCTIEKADASSRALVAAYIGPVRLIDNSALGKL